MFNPHLSVLPYHGRTDGYLDTTSISLRYWSGMDIRCSNLGRGERRILLPLKYQPHPEGRGSRRHFRIILHHSASPKSWVDSPAHLSAFPPSASPKSTHSLSSGGGGREGGGKEGGWINMRREAHLRPPSILLKRNSSLLHVAHIRDRGKK